MRVTNTAAQRRDPLDGLPAMIEASEARGQALLAEADQLPAEGMDEARAVLEALGFEIIGPTDGDPLFVDVKMPPGWKKVPTSHSMWLDLVDVDGWKRAEIFYKAAFYDRGAHIRMRRRFALQTRNLNERTRAMGYVLDNREPPNDETQYRVIWQTEPLVFATKEDLWDAGADEKQRAACEAWLAEHLPDWKDPLAYWTDAERPTVGTFPSWRS